MAPLVSDRLLSDMLRTRPSAKRFTTSVSDLLLSDMLRTVNSNLIKPLRVSGRLLSDKRKHPRPSISDCRGCFGYVFTR